MARLTTALTALLVVWLCGTASAQEAEKMIWTQSPCSQYPVMNDLVKKHGEKPLFIGEGYTFEAGTGKPFRGGMLFVVDQDKGNWTIFQVFQDGMACMLFNGGKFQPYMGD